MERKKEKKLRIPPESLGEDAVLVRIALAAQFLGLPIGLGPNDRRLALGLGTDGLRLLLAVGAKIRRLALTLGAHALVDGLAVGGRQIDSGQAHVDHLDAQACGLPVHVGLNAVHQLRALGADDGIPGGAGEDVAHGRVGEARRRWLARAMLPTA